MPDTRNMTPEQYATFTGKMSFPAGHTEQVQERAPEPEPQKCPFCNCERVDTFEDDFYVRCRGCLAEGPIKKSRAEAVQIWNRIMLKEPT